MKKKKILTSLLLGIFMLGIMMPVAYANKTRNIDLKVNADNSVQVTMKFKDIDEAKWALKSIMKMKAENIICGYEDGSFRPNKPVSKAEAVVLAMRAAGLQNEIDQMVVDSSLLVFKDAENIPLWAQKAIALALKKGYIETDLSGNFQPNKAASREWVVKLVAKVLGLKPVSINLPFNDANKISADSLGYVAAVAYKQLISGYPDGSFRPYKPVTRAEIAVMLGLSIKELPIPGQFKNKAEGIVVSVLAQNQVNSAVYSQVYQGTITLKLNHDDDEEDNLNNNALNTVVTYPVASAALIYINDNSAFLKDIAPGSKAEIVLDQQGVAQYIEVEPVTVNGVVAAVYNDKITIDENGWEKEHKYSTNIPKLTTYAVAKDAVIKLNGKAIALTALQAKYVVKLTLNADQKVTIIKASRYQQDTDEDDKDDDDKDHKDDKDKDHKDDKSKDRKDNKDKNGNGKKDKQHKEDREEDEDDDDDDDDDE